MMFQISFHSMSLVRSARHAARVVAVSLVPIVVLMGPLAAETQSEALPKKIVLSRLANVPDQWVGGEILKSVYAKLGITVEFLDVEAKRALALSSAGDVDGEIQRVAAVAQQYLTLLQLQPAINYIEPAVFTAGLEFTVTGWNSIKDYQVGIVRGVGSSEAGTSGMSKVYRGTSLEELVRMLDRERFDLLVTDLFSGKVEIRRQQLESRIHPLLPPLERIYIYHYLHERHRTLVPQVEAVLREMNDSGELEQLRAKLVAQALEQAGEPRG
jgi:hypothetical protein